MIENLLSTREFAERFSVSQRTAERWRVTGDGPPFVRIGPRKVGYRVRDAEAWAARRTYDHRAAELASHTTVKNFPSNIRRRRFNGDASKVA